MTEGPVKVQLQLQLSLVRAAQAVLTLTIITCIGVEDVKSLSLVPTSVFLGDSSHFGRRLFLNIFGCYSGTFFSTSTGNLPRNSWTNNSHISAASAADDAELYEIQSQSPSNALVTRLGNFARYDPIIVRQEHDYGDNYWTNERKVSTNIGRSRILAKELSPLQQPLALNSNTELYYAPLLFGSWNVTATLRQKVYPYGFPFVPSNSLIDGSPRNRMEPVGSTTSYESHYFSTLPNSLQNQIAVNLGTGVPQSKILQDRCYNSISLSRGYRHLVPVESVTWDYRNNPTKVVLEYGYGLLAEDMRPLGNRRTEIFITARMNEYVSENSNVFASAERYRSVSLEPGNVIVSDAETITEFHRIDQDTLKAISRIAVYLTPNPNNREGVLWQQVNGKAVAFFDYELSMNRKKETLSSFDDSGRTVNTEVACVETPNGIVQCQ